MKIAFLNIYSGINLRGAETFTHQLANSFSNEHSVVFFQAGQATPEQQTKVVTVQINPAQPQETFSKNLYQKVLKVIFLDKASRSVLLFTLKVLPQLLKSKFDLLVPMNGFWQVLLLQIFRPFCKYKIMITGHSGPGWDERFNLYLKPDVFIATTRPSYNWAKQTCFWTRIEQVPYGIEISKFRNVKPASLLLPRPIVLCPAALVEYKRADLAIKAVSKLKSVSLLLLGKGPLSSKLSALGKKLLDKRFMITSVPNNRMPEYYAVADLVTLPSAPQENSPMVFLESLAAGKVVVATDTQRNRWILEEAGFYCNPKNLYKYSTTIKKALEKCQSPSIKSKIARALDKFNIEAVTQQYADIIGSLFSYETK